MEVNGITFSEIVDVYDNHGYDREVEVLGYDDVGNEYIAVGMESVGELVEIYEDTIELVKSLTVNPEFKDFDWDTPIKDQPWYTPSTEVDLDRDIPGFDGTWKALDKI